MLRKARLLVVAAAALTVLATAAPSADAYRTLLIGAGGAIRQVSQGGIAFVGGLILVSCNITLNGEIEPGPYTTELPIVAGRITNLEWRECTGGEILSILNLPWSIRIERILETNRETRIAGIRPEAITGGLVSLVESGGRRPVGFQLELETIVCLYGGRGESPSALLPLTRAREREGRFFYSLGALTVLESVRFRKSSGPETCPGEGFIRGRFTAAEPAQTAIFQ